MRKQWRCFHCDEVFTSRREATIHFGADEDSEALCVIKSSDRHLGVYIRDMEQQLDQYRAEDSHVLRAMASLEADHRQAMIRAEEDGYNKGVRDMMQAAKDDAAISAGKRE